MNIQETKNQIIKQVNSCRNEEHLESINRMMDNTLRPLLPHDEASVAIFEVIASDIITRIWKRKRKIPTIIACIGTRRTIKPIDNV